MNTDADLEAQLPGSPEHQRREIDEWKKYADRLSAECRSLRSQLEQSEIDVYRRGDDIRWWRELAEERGREIDELERQVKTLESEIRALEAEAE